MGRARYLGPGARAQEELMIGIYIMLGGMVLFATIVGVWDLIGQRRSRRNLTRR